MNHTYIAKEDIVFVFIYLLEQNASRMCRKVSNEQSKAAGGAGREELVVRVNRRRRRWEREMSLVLVIWASWLIVALI